MADTITPNTTVNFTAPQYYTDTAASVAGGIQDLYGDQGYLKNVQNNWYSQSPTQGALGQYAQFNPTQQQQFMNPYVQNVVNANTQQSNQNLMENILPNVNSTFTGAGQFGSSRNADFTNRAIRDQQQTLANTNAGALMQAQQNAGTQYADWTKTGLSAAQNDFQNWLTKANFPMTAINTTQGALTALKPGQMSYQSVGAEPTNIDKLASVLGILNTGANDNTINSLLSWIGEGGLNLSGK